MSNPQEEIKPSAGLLPVLKEVFDFNWRNGCEVPDGAHPHSAAWFVRQSHALRDKVAAAIAAEEAGRGADAKPGQPDGWIASSLHGEVRAERTRLRKELEVANKTVASRDQELREVHRDLEAAKTSRDNAEAAVDEAEARALRHRREMHDMEERAEKAEASSGDEKLRRLRDEVETRAVTAGSRSHEDIAAALFSVRSYIDQLKNDQLLAEQPTEPEPAAERGDDGPRKSTVGDVLRLPGYGGGFRVWRVVGVHLGGKCQEGTYALEPLDWYANETIHVPCIILETHRELARAGGAK